MPLGKTVVDYVVPACKLWGPGAAQVTVPIMSSFASDIWVPASNILDRSMGLGSQEISDPEDYQVRSSSMLLLMRLATEYITGMWGLYN